MGTVRCCTYYDCPCLTEWYGEGAVPPTTPSLYQNFQQVLATIGGTAPPLYQICIRYIKRRLLRNGTSRKSLLFTHVSELQNHPYLVQRGRRTSYGHLRFLVQRGHCTSYIHQRLTEKVFFRRYGALAVPFSQAKVIIVEELPISYFTVTLMVREPFLTMFTPGCG